MAVNQLAFGSDIAKRITWEAWEFTVVGPNFVEVTNASYGYQKDDHTYTVEVEVRDGLALPAECDCPADVHRESDCKHKVALATVGGPTVMNAAVTFENTDSSSRSVEPETMTDRLRADGGCDCDPSEFPCWECYRTGRRELPE